MIRSIEPRDYKQCLDIYNYYVINTSYSLEWYPIPINDFSSRINNLIASYPYLVYEVDNKILAYAYLSPFNTRSGYLHTTDVSIYVHHDYLRSGIGKELLTNLIVLAKQHNINNLISIITSANQGSLAFHKNLGFKEVATFKGIASKFDQTLDVIYMQYHLD